MTTLDATLQLLQEQSFVSIREIQKSPTRALDGFKIILNNGKMQGVYIPQEDLDEYLEDLKAMNSQAYLDMIAQARSEKAVSADEVWNELGV